MQSTKDCSTFNPFYLRILFSEIALRFGSSNYFGTMHLSISLSFWVCVIVSFSPAISLISPSTTLRTHVCKKSKVRQLSTERFLLNEKNSRRDFVFHVAGLLTTIAGTKPSEAAIDADPEKDPIKYLDEFFWVDKSDPSKEEFSWVLNDEERVRKRPLNVGKVPHEMGEKWPNTASPIPRSSPTLSDTVASDLEKAIRDSVTVNGSVGPLTHGK